MRHIWRHTHTLVFQIDEYTLRAKKEIAARASDHTASVRELAAKKDETERQIQLEQQRERDMLMSGFFVPPTDGRLTPSSH